MRGRTAAEAIVIALGSTALTIGELMRVVGCSSRHVYICVAELRAQGLIEPDALRLTPYGFATVHGAPPAPVPEAGTAIGAAAPAERRAEAIRIGRAIPTRLSFDEQVARVRAGRATLSRPVRTHPVTPEMTLGGVGSAML